MPNSEINTELALDVFIRSRTKVYYKGSAKSLSSTNKTGEFDILPMHANFVTMIKGWAVIDRSLPTEKKVEFESAVVSVTGSRVDVYVGV